MLAWIHGREENFQSATCSEVGKSRSLCLLVESKSRIEVAAGRSAFCESFRNERTFSGLTIGSEVDIEAIQVNIAALRTIEILCSQNIQVAWEDRFEIAIRARWEVDEGTIEVHQRGGIGIPCASQAEKQSDASCCSPRHVLAVVIVPCIVGGEDCQTGLEGRVDPNTPETTVCVFNAQTAARESPQSTQRHRQATVGSFDELHADLVRPQREGFANTSFLLFGNGIGLSDAAHRTITTLEVVIDRANAVELITRERGVDVVLEGFRYVPRTRIIVRTDQIQRMDFGINIRRQQQRCQRYGFGADRSQIRCGIERRTQSIQCDR